MDALPAPDTYNREEFLRKSLPLIRQIAGQHTGRVLHWGQDEELSIALIAFNSALDVYEYKKGTNFTALAAVIIKRRLIDYYRSGQRHGNREIPVGDFINDLSDDKLARPGYMESLLAEERRREIELFTRGLGDLGIQLEDLVALAPRHTALREQMIFAAKAIIGDPQIYRAVTASGRLPLDRLCQLTGISTAVLGKRRKFLLALVHVISHASDYPFISTYLNLEGEEQ